MNTLNYKLALIGASCLQLANAQTSKPNVLLIYTDDQGTLDMNCYGAKDLRTDNMDELARRGVSFSQFYAAPVSSASRASLMTGQFTRHAGLYDNAGGVGLPPERETIAERMKQNGYRTALVGKWHLGSDYNYRPTQQGFDYFWGFLGGCVDSYSHFFYWDGPNKHDLWRNNQEIFEYGKFFAEGTLREAKAFINEYGNTDDPFFLYWAVNIPHYPLQPSQKWLDYYSDVPNPRRMYAAFISTFDDYLGEMITFLKAKGLYDNTIIVLQSDNGHSTEIRSFGSGGYCGNYRGAKFSLFEGGIRVPSIISWPGHIPEGESRNQLAMNVDWFPTLLDLCGISAEGNDFDGKSLVNVIKNNGLTPHDVLHFDFDQQWAVRKGDWKLIKDAYDVKENDNNDRLKGYYLTNLQKDPTESSNLADKYPQIVKELLQCRDEYLKHISK